MKSRCELPDPLALHEARLKSDVTARSAAGVFSVDGGYVVKIYRAASTPSTAENYRARLCAELEAYKRVCSRPELATLVPECLGRVRVSQVTSASGTEVSHLYSLDCAFALEEIAGEALKFTEIPSDSRNHVRWLQKLFKSAHIAMSGDESYLGWESRETIRVIDWFEVNAPVGHAP